MSRTEIILFSVTLCVQHRQVNTDIENCYIIVALSLEVTTHQLPNIVLEFGAQTAAESTLACIKVCKL